MIDMEKIKEELIIEAKNKHGKIYPTPGKDSLFDCFTMPLPGKLCLWFKSEGGNLHIISEEVE